MKKRIIGTATSLLVAIFALLAAAPPAPASATVYWCPDGVFCAWPWYNGQSSTRWEYGVGTYGINRCAKLNISQTNKWKSAWNSLGAYGNYELAVYYYDSANCTGQPYALYSGQAGNLTLDAKASSFKFVTYSP